MDGRLDRGAQRLRPDLDIVLRASQGITVLCGMTHDLCRKADGLESHKPCTITRKGNGVLGGHSTGVGGIVAMGRKISIEPCLELI